MEPVRYKIYVLKLEKNKFYVGKTGNFFNRMEYHRAGTCEWTQLYKPVDVVEVRQSVGEFDEEITTKSYMKMYGIDNVRGAQYTQIVLSNVQVSEIRKSIECADDLCFSCGKPGHLSIDCAKNFSSTSSTSTSSRAKRTKSKGSKTKPAKVGSKCGRCGRYGHQTEGCYATTHLFGHSLQGSLPVATSSADSEIDYTSLVMSALSTKLE